MLMQNILLGRDIPKYTNMWKHVYNTLHHSYNTIRDLRTFIFNIFFILTGLLLLGCSTQELSQSELLANKHFCFELKADILANIETQAAKHGGLTYMHFERLEEIFYSPVRASCMYTTQVTEISESRDCVFYKLYDFYARDYAIESIMVINLDTSTCDYHKTRRLYNDTIQSLQ